MTGNWTGTRNRLASRSTMWVAILSSWVLLVGLLAWSLLPELTQTFSVSKAISVAIFFLCASASMLLGLHQALAAVLSTATVRASDSPASEAEVHAVAVLYATMNDFRAEALFSCICQDFPCFHVFVLDDSTDEISAQSIDAFSSQFHTGVTVLRRTDRHGFKAGNLNNALHRIGHNFPFFALADADTILPPDFIRKTLPAFRDPKVAFVQCSIRVSSDAPGSEFASDLGPSDSVYWNSIVPASAGHGFLMMHGHAAMVRTSACLEVGGFPKLVAEDLAFSTRVRQHGYRGVFSPEVVCQEEFPRTYDHFSVRQLKYARGALEHLVREMLSFMVAPHVPWHEKIDRLSGSLILLSPIPFALALLLCSVLSTFPNATPEFPLTVRILAGFSFLLPLVPMILLLWRRPKALFQLSSTTLACHLSLVIRICGSCAKLIFTGVTSFTPTGDDNSVCKISAIEAAIEWLVVIALLIWAMHVKELSGFALGAALSVGVFARTVGWNHWVTKSLIPIPLILVLLIFLIGTTGDLLLAGTIVVSSSTSRVV